MEKKLLDYMVHRIESIDKKVDSLLKFKWQIIGASLALSTVITILAQMILIFQNK